MKKINELERASFWKRFLRDSQRSLETIREVYAEGQLDEQAVPAYLNPNPLARWLFWSRLRVCAREVLAANGTTCLDFGCGSGVMFPLLNQRFNHIVAVDLMPELPKQYVEQMKKRGWLTHGEIEILSSLESHTYPENHFDLILALDVLEHVGNLDELLILFASHLKSSGFLLVSGPTESVIYKIGRAITGYSGHYHVRSIYHVTASMEKHFNIETVQRLVFPFTLFLVLKATKK